MHKFGEKQVYSSLFNLKKSHNSFMPIQFNDTDGY